MYKPAPTPRDYEDFGILYHHAARFKSFAYAGSAGSISVRAVRMSQCGQRTIRKDYSVPAFLASTYARYREVWQDFKEGLEEFGRKSGLFDESFRQAARNKRVRALSVGNTKVGKEDAKG